MCQMLEINFMQDKHKPNIPVGGENPLTCFEQLVSQIYLFFNEKKNSHAVEHRK